MPPMKALTGDTGVRHWIKKSNSTNCTFKSFGTYFLPVTERGSQFGAMVFGTCLVSQEFCLTHNLYKCELEGMELQRR